LLQDWSGRLGKDQSGHESVCKPPEIRADGSPCSAIESICLAAGRTGKVQLNGVDLEAGDGAAITAETNLEIQSQANAEILLFDLK
jgi:hypothetical protein